MFKYAVIHDIITPDINKTQYLNIKKAGNPNAYNRKPFTKEEVNTINVEIEKKGKLIVAETEAHDTDVATSQAMVGPVPLWYDNSVEYDCYAKSTVTYDLDKTKATANTLTKVVT